ncbi:hypothetical protein K1T71_014570 [Dendrolimus kikuchii]|uniref:Uncharacterized protein n=1 Tax=Dendrolimus kikuchii TaxID=765133 RepID=A0ACC1CEF1_9NEOP|nr:hypothetical protein K1T71_014570 [Dendrolimus kikuchii]
MNSEHDTLLFHTEVSWLSKRSMLSRLYDLRTGVQIFLTNKDNKELLDHFCEPQFQLHFAYLVNFFESIHVTDWVLIYEINYTRNRTRYPIIPVSYDSKGLSHLTTRTHMYTSDGTIH